MKLFVLFLLSLTISCGQCGSAAFSFRSFCPVVRFNYIYNKFEVNVPLRSTASLKLAELHVKSNAALASKDSGVTIVGNVDDRSEPSLSLLCNSYNRCQTLKSELMTNPKFLQRALHLSAVVGGDSSGQSRETDMSAIAMRSVNLMSPNCDRGWVVFQQRVNPNLSFKQNWRTYVQGFGSPENNYWMGLDNLFIATSAGIAYKFAPCRLRIEVTSIYGKKYWGEWSQFEVQSANVNYRMYVRGWVRGSTIVSSTIGHAYGAAFSTYDRDHDAWRRGSCSQNYGFAGWWYKACHGMNLNGFYPNRKVNNPMYACIHIHGKYVPMIKTKMMYKCFDRVPESRRRRRG